MERRLSWAQEVGGSIPPVPTIPRNPPDSVLSKAWRAVLMLDPCVYCGRPAAGLDHLAALTRGGTDGWANRAPACVRCDQAKGNAPLLAFLWCCEKARRRVEQRIAGRAQHGHPRLSVQQVVATWQGSLASGIKKFQRR